jgi:hypothetical protein
MKSYPGMNIMRGVLLGVALAAAACGGEKNVASKSAAASTEAQAKGGSAGGGHEHGGPDATSTATAMDHSAHGTSTDTHAGMNHGAAAGGAMDHSAHGATGAVDHAAMGHGATTNAHAGHGTTTGEGAVDHAAMGHGTTTNAHGGHGTTTGTGAVDHAAMGHGTTATTQVDHSQHAATPAGAPATAAAPRSNAEMQRVDPAATLRRDAFDAPSAVSVSEAAKASQGGGHAGHDTRSITPGQDHENPPAPMPATRDGSTTAAPAPDHSQHKPPAEND